VGYRTVATDGARTTNGVAAAHRPGTNGAVTPSGKNGAVSPAPIVKLTKVTKSFGKTAVFSDVSITIAQGELIEITGPSGAGKTTLLRLIHGQLRPNRGEVWVEGRGLHRWWRRGLGRIRRDVAFLFQEQRLLPRLTAMENLTFALQVTDPSLPNRTIRRRALEALESLSLAHRRRAYPHQMSAGERQRIAVARALAGRPRVVLADEPLASIDEDNALIVMRLLEEAAANGTTVIVATHQPTFRTSRLLRLPSGNVLVNRDKPHHANGTRVAAPLWRRVLPGRAKARKNGYHRANGASSPLPTWRRLAALGANGFRLVVLNGLRSWRRDLRLTAPALGSMAVTLVLCGMLALVGIAVARVASQQAGQASVVRVYLAADATPAAVTALESRLRADPRVSSVTEVSAAQALAQASSRPGLYSLASLSDTNPFPASLDVQVRQVNNVGAVASEVTGDPAADATYPTSYDPDTYARLRKIALIAGGIGGGLLLLFGLVAYAVSANSMRGIAAARREEVTITRLLGARGWMLRGPFVTEGLMTGALAGALAGAVVAGAWVLATRFEAETYSQVLPGVGPDAVRYVIAAVIAAGFVLGALTSMLGFRRIRA
jgi:ABC-type ATPase involved in cell division/cell division protein FtsX